MTDVDQNGEELDENLTSDFPPDHPMAADEGVTGLEQLGGESVAERDERTEPEAWEQTEGPPDGAPTITDDPGVGYEDDEKDMVVAPAEERPTGPLAEDDEVSGDETARDYGTERSPRAAEEDAVHVEDASRTGP